MSFKQRISRLTGIDERFLPSSYQIIGNVLLLKFMKIKKVSQKKIIAKSVMKLMPYVKTVCEAIKVEGELRMPKLRKLAGNGTVTVHKEHGMLYKLDASKIMFSKGNMSERQRLLSKVGKNETVIDMFAGIGYFSLPLARNVKKVYAIEKNPLSFRYLKKNIKLNGMSNMEPVLGDNRTIALQGMADRIIMGYFPDTEKFLPAAARLLKKGGIIHFHNAYREDELWGKPIKHLDGLGVKYKILSKKKVKSVAPRTYHVVLDILLEK